MIRYEDLKREGTHEGHPGSKVAPGVGKLTRHACLQHLGLQGRRAKDCFLGRRPSTAQARQARARGAPAAALSAWATGVPPAPLCPSTTPCDAHLPYRWRLPSNAGGGCRPKRWTDRWGDGLAGTWKAARGSGFEGAKAGHRSRLATRQAPAAWQRVDDAGAARCMRGTGGAQQHQQATAGSPTLQVWLVHGQVEAHLNALPAAARSAAAARVGDHQLSARPCCAPLAPCPCTHLSAGSVRTKYMSRCSSRSS